MSAATFADLKFETMKTIPGGRQARVFFPNGYGASVVCHSFSYGGEQGLFELAVLAGKEGASELTYDTPVTSDVEGYLPPDRVTELLAQIEALPARGEAVS